MAQWKNSDNFKPRLNFLLCGFYRKEKSSRHVAMVAKFLDLNKPWSCKYDEKKKNETIKMYDCSVHDCTQEFDNANGLLYQGSLLRCRDFSTMVTWRHTSLYYIGEGPVGGNYGNHVKAQEDRSASPLKVPALLRTFRHFKKCLPLVHGGAGP